MLFPLKVIARKVSAVENIGTSWESDSIRLCANRNFFKDLVSSFLSSKNNKPIVTFTVWTKIYKQIKILAMLSVYNTVLLTVYFLIECFLPGRHLDKFYRWNNFSRQSHSFCCNRYQLCSQKENWLSQMHLQVFKIFNFGTHL